MKGVFDTKPNSGYDDRIEERYHFPSRYRTLAAQMVGDWIVYREPRRNQGRQAYVAVARVVELVEDRKLAGHVYAMVDDFLAFDRPVDFSSNGVYAEAPLRNLANTSRPGAFLQGKSVRELLPADFSTIVRAGLRETLLFENAVRLELDPVHVDPETLTLVQAPPDEQERHIQQILLNKKIRAANFRRHVCAAYDNTCAVTGLRMINGGGKAEVQAAHIWPVAAGGPDVIQNGIALSGTVHWLFDRHLISLTDDYRLLVSHNKVPADLQSLFAKQLDRICLPVDSALRPHPKYLARHRSIFAGGK